MLQPPFKSKWFWVVSFLGYLNTEPNRIFGALGTIQAIVCRLLQKSTPCFVGIKQFIWPNGIIFHQPRFPWNKTLPFRGPGRVFGRYNLTRFTPQTSHTSEGGTLWCSTDSSSWHGPRCWNAWNRYPVNPPPKKKTEANKGWTKIHC